MPVSSSPSDVVRSFYDQIIRLHPLGIPEGEAKRNLQPFMSARLARQLDLMQKCEKDYYRRNEKKLKSEQLKPTISWLEHGLFSGGNEAARPAEAAITRIVPAGNMRFRVYLQFTYREKVETHGRPPVNSNAYSWPGIAVVVYEGNRYAIDDFIPIDRSSGRELAALSGDFPECKGPRWVGLKGRDW